MTAEAGRLPGEHSNPVVPGIRWLSGPSLRLHATMLAGVALCVAATWIEFSRAREGHVVAWAYTFEWPLFGVMGVYLWWKLLHPEPTAGRSPGTRGRSKPQARAYDGIALDDPDLIAWQDYLARLEAADPPGGPPGRTAG